GGERDARRERSERVVDPRWPPVQLERARVGLVRPREQPCGLRAARAEEARETDDLPGEDLEVVGLDPAGAPETGRSDRRRPAVVRGARSRARALLEARELVAGAADH